LSTVSGSDCLSETHGGVGANVCDTILEGDTVVQATFNLRPPPCIVPGLKGRTLANAKRLLKNQHCRVGEITHAFSSRTKEGRVISQNPKAHWHLANGAVDLLISKGKR
jgi:beta-lactam-binding protein with PASTA domain